MKDIEFLPAWFPVMMENVLKEKREKYGPLTTDPASIPGNLVQLKLQVSELNLTLTTKHMTKPDEFEDAIRTAVHVANHAALIADSISHMRYAREEAESMEDLPQEREMEDSDDEEYVEGEDPGEDYNGEEATDADGV